MKHLLIVLFYVLVGSIQKCDAQTFSLKSTISNFDDSLSKIERLYLANLDLTELPQWIFKCVNLKEVDLSNNQQLDLQKTFEQLALFESLRKVTIQLVNKKIPENIYKLKKIEYLDLRLNKLTELPDSISYCEHLAGISLDNNKMSYLGIARLCKALPNLDYLSLSKNNLDSLPPELCIPKLIYLDLYANNITSFPDCFYQSKTIRIIHFTGVIADGITNPPPVDLDMQGMRDKFKKAGRCVSIE